MIEILKTEGNRLIEATFDDTNIWVNLTSPNQNEINQISSKLNIDADFLTAALDPEEVSRLEMLEDSVLVLVNASIEEEGGGYSTIPIGIIVKNNIIITVTLKPLPVLNKMKKYTKEFANPSKQTKFVFQIIYNMTLEYLLHLRKIDKTTDKIEDELYESPKNEYLIQLLTLEKNLVYFTTALKSDEQVINKILRFKALPIYEEDEELFEDVIIELKQAQEMATINSKIIRSIRDAFATIMSNSLNNVMKTLASFTIILTVPTMIFSFFGMNTYFGRGANTLTATLLISLVALLVATILYIVMKKKNML